MLFNFSKIKKGIINKKCVSLIIRISQNKNRNPDASAITYIF